MELDENTPLFVISVAAELSGMHERGLFPGASLALVLPGGEEIALCAGLASREDERAMRPKDRMPAGSIGKTFVAAAALRLRQAGRLDLEDAASRWLGEEEWFARLPNSEHLTLRNLLEHSSGIPEYYVNPGFIENLREEPARVRPPEELVSLVLDAPPLFAAGEGWSYADTNYLLVGMVIERASQKTFYEQVREHFLIPHGLRDTLPSDRRDLPGLAQGYVVMGQGLGFPARALVDGRLAVNPQFEWCGGGFATTPLDLARWARVLYQGRAFEGEYLDELLAGVETGRLPGERYGLGTFLRGTRAGPMRGHEGFYPGYLSAMAFFPESGFAAALQVNTDDLRGLGVRSMHTLLEPFAVIATEALGGGATPEGEGGG